MQTGVRAVSACRRSVASWPVASPSDLPVDCLLKAGDDLGFAGVLAVVLAQLAGVVVEGPRLGDFRCRELDDDVQRPDPLEVVRKVGPDAERGLAILPREALDLDGAVRVEGIAEDHLLGARVDAQRAVFVDDLAQLFAVVAAVDAQPLEEVGEILREVETEDLPSERVVEIGPQGAAEGRSPALHRQVVGHLRAVHAADGRDELVGHRSDGCQTVFHGQIDVARPHEPAVPASRLTARLQGADHRILRLERSPAAGAEVAEDAPGAEQPLRLAAGAAVAVRVVERRGLARHPVVELGDDGQHLHLQQDRVGPAALEIDVQVTLVILPDADPPAVEAIALQVVVEPVGDVGAAALHEVDLFVGDDQLFEQGDLLGEPFGESGRVDGPVTVGEGVPDAGSREVVDDGAAHRELVEVVVGEVGDDRFHVRGGLSWLAPAPSAAGTSRKVNQIFRDLQMPDATRPPPGRWQTWRTCPTLPQPRSDVAVGGGGEGESRDVAPRDGAAHRVEQRKVVGRDGIVTLRSVIRHAERPVEQRSDDRHRLARRIERDPLDRPHPIARHQQGMEPVPFVGHEGQHPAAAELGDEEVAQLHPLGQLDGPHVGTPLHHLEVEQPSVGIEQHIAFVVLLAGRGVAGNLPDGEPHPLAEHRRRKARTLRAVDAVRSHVDELDAALRQAEGIRRHRQIDAPGERLEQEVDSRRGPIEVFGRRAEDERGLLHLAQRDGTPRHRIGEAVVGDQLPGIEERQQRVELAARVAHAAAVEVFGLLVVVADHDEVTEHLAVEGEGGVRRFCGEVADCPRQLPEQQYGREKPEEKFCETCHFHRVLEVQS